MGRLLVILLIMLIPLRSWSAELMAVQMAQSQFVVDSTGVQTSAPTMPADCPMMFETGAEAGDAGTALKSHSSCQACQLCMPLAAYDTLVFNVTSQPPQARLASIDVSFISAELARQVKPPIL